MVSFDFNNSFNFASAKAGALQVDKNSGGGRQAIDFLGREGPVSKEDVDTFRTAFINKIEVNLERKIESKDDLEILSLLSKLQGHSTFQGELGRNFDHVASLDGLPGVSKYDLLNSPDSGWKGQPYKAGGTL